MVKNGLGRRVWLACLSLGMVLATGTGGSAVAMTPDDATPANEDVCLDLKNYTPGLYGLCVAYCEAQDLDLVVKVKLPKQLLMSPQ